MFSRFALLTLSCCLFSLPTNAAVTFSSGTTKVPLLELYTSEGCSSCPPADKWLSTFQQHPELWNKVVPVAFHVNYWNNLGWKDPFSTKNNSYRQYNYKHNGNIRAVYTPGFVFNGKESRNRFLNRVLPENNDMPGDLQLQLDGDKLTASFINSSTEQQSLILNITLLGFDLETKIPAGENRGKVLTHDFVVLGHQKNLSQTKQWQVSLPPPIVSSDKTAIAAWISTENNPTPIQATGGWLP
ncbi:MAG: DUF1223 domain-containing protein [Pseudomonadales bacterium]